MDFIRRLPTIVVGLSLFAVPTVLAQQTTPQSANDSLIKSGEYLARAGDCFSCHTQTGGTPMAGGLQVPTPYGGIASPNITPDPETGIGKWSDNDFYRLLHEGIEPDGSYVYPVMPFDHYTRVSRDDALAIKAFLFSLPPAHPPRQSSHLEFPFDIRASLAAWRALFFTPSTFQADAALSAKANRGAYLVEGLGHCGACHTPRNILSGSKKTQALGGGEITGQGWFAPNISSDIGQGVGGWTEQDLVDYMKTGVAPDKAIVGGPMAEVIHTSLHYLSDEDLHAIATYLKLAPAMELYSAKRPAALAGATSYLNYCASCHQPDGKGIEHAVPSLVGNGVVVAGGPQDVIRTILGGMPANGDFAAMPGFATMLTSADIAEIANYIRASWGNAAPPNATATMAENLSKQTTTMLAGTAACTPVQPQSVAEAISAQHIDKALQQIDADNMLEQIDIIVPKLKSVPLAQADLLNGLISAYCPIAMSSTAAPPQQRLQLLQRFSTLVYSQLATHR
jgi:mono/diheme cytochrome c family protein